MPSDIFDRTTANRLAIADAVADLTPEQQEMPSLCAGWTVREVVAHLVMQVDVSLRNFPGEVIRQRGSADRASDVIARRIAQRPYGELVKTLRTKADTNLSTALIGAMGPFADTCIHLCDIARPLGLAADSSLDDWRLVLDFLVTRKAQRGFVRAGQLDGLALRATDQEWSWGSGEVAEGTSEALAMSICARAAGAAELSGPGAALLGQRISG